VEIPENTHTGLLVLKVSLLKVWRNLKCFSLGTVEIPTKARHEDTSQLSLSLVVMSDVSDLIWNHLDS
jgi:hypothetical protein